MAVPSIDHFGAAHEAFGGVHGDGAHGVFAQMLRHFQNQTLAIIGGFECVQDRGQVAVERDVHDGTDDLRYATGLFLCHLFRPSLDCLERFRARNDFDEFFGDLGLALAVIAQLSFLIISPALRVALSMAHICAP